VINAPYSMSVQQLQQLRISVFANGTETDHKQPNYYAAAQKLQIYHEFQSPSNTTTSSIIERILENRLVYLKRNEKKASSLAAILKQQSDEYSKSILNHQKDNDNDFNSLTDGERQSIKTSFDDMQQ